VSAKPHQHFEEEKNYFHRLSNHKENFFFVLKFKHFAGTPKLRFFFTNLKKLYKYFFSALIVCVYEDPVVPEQAATVTEKLGEYLISVGY